MKKKILFIYYIITKKDQLAQIQSETRVDGEISRRVVQLSHDRLVHHIQDSLFAHSVWCHLRWLDWMKKKNFSLAK